MAIGALYGISFTALPAPRGRPAEWRALVLDTPTQRITTAIVFVGIALVLLRIAWRHFKNEQDR